MPTLRQGIKNTAQMIAVRDSNASALICGVFIPELKSSIDGLCGHRPNSNLSLDSSNKLPWHLLEISRDLRYVCMILSGSDLIKNSTASDPQELSHASESIKRIYTSAIGIRNKEEQSRIASEILGVAIYAESTCSALLRK
jgi:hypothetical protein